jgi:SAM-dependent methyltransferase
VTAVASLRRRAGAHLGRRLVLLDPTRRARFARALGALERLPRDARVRVLDAGCGDGSFTQAVARRRPEWEVVGLDVNEELLERARLRAAASGIENVTFRHADLTAELGDAEFDGVAAIQCLEEIEADELALFSIVRALKPGGLFVAQVPEREWRPVLPWAEPTWRHEVRHGYRREELVALLERAGLRDVETRPADHVVVRLAQELTDALKGYTIGVRALVHPALRTATELELLGLRLGDARSIFVTAIRGLEPARLASPPGGSSALVDAAPGCDGPSAYDDAKPPPDLRPLGRRAREGTLCDGPAQNTGDKPARQGQMPQRLAPVADDQTGYR